MEHARLYFLHLHSGCASLLRREDYLVGMGSFSLMTFLFGIVVVMLGFLGMLMVMVVIEMVMGLASASDHSRHEDYR